MIHIVNQFVSPIHFTPIYVNKKEPSYFRLLQIVNQDGDDYDTFRLLQSGAPQDCMGSELQRPRSIRGSKDGQTSAAYQA